MPWCTCHVHGYWLTRYIEETRPGLLKDVLSQRTQRKELEGKIATADGKELGVFWEEMDRELVAHFKHGGKAA